ncbi:hypothetical protein SLE2022_281890 [Rubroshorea leprosula]
MTFQHVIIGHIYDVDLDWQPVVAECLQHRAAVAGGNFRSLRSLVVVTKKWQAGFSAEGCTKVDAGNLENRKACLAGDRSWSPTWHSNTQYKIWIYAEKTVSSGCVNEELEEGVSLKERT